MIRAAIQERKSTEVGKEVDRMRLKVREEEDIDRGRLKSYANK